MKRALILFFILLTLKAFPQYSSYNGFNLFPIDTFRFLNIFINIIYDQTPNLNPIGENPDIWQPTTTTSINVNPPSYLLNFMDTGINPGNNYNGSMTKYFTESSFNQFLLLGDFVVVNIYS